MPQLDLEKPILSKNRIYQYHPILPCGVVPGVTLVASCEGAPRRVDFYRYKDYLRNGDDYQWDLFDQRAIPPRIEMFNEAHIHWLANNSRFSRKNLRELRTFEVFLRQQFGSKYREH